ncbi:MAG: hypothetical protein DDT26_01938 [Dehalococcoidia bacterium]|nr:hypothetical protein [Chloroflexota bacterium]
MFYDVRNKNTQEVVQVNMSISAFEEYLAANPHLEQVHITSAAMSYSGDPRTRKPTNNFRDRLKEIKSAHSQGWSTASKSTINTF